MLDLTQWGQVAYMYVRVRVHVCVRVRVWVNKEWNWIFHPFPNLGNG